MALPHLDLRVIFGRAINFKAGSPSGTPTEAAARRFAATFHHVDFVAVEVTRLSLNPAGKELLLHCYDGWEVSNQ